MTVRDFSDLPAGYAPEVFAIERAVAAGESMLLTGAPGTGKLMMAARVPTILPPLSGDQIIRREAFALAFRQPVLPDSDEWRRPPFRAPHHTVSAQAMRAEFFQAAGGVLCLDELHEFSSLAIDTIADLQCTVPNPVRPLIIGSAIQCPCGMHGSVATTDRRTCGCGRASIERHLSRLSRVTTVLGIKLRNVIAVPWIDRRTGGDRCESSSSIGARVRAARAGLTPITLGDGEPIAADFTAPWIDQ